MLPIIILAGLGGIIAWTVREKNTGMTGHLLAPIGASDALPPKKMYRDAKTPEGFLGPPLQPEEERMLTLLILWAKDKKYPAGQKRFMTAGLAKELAKIAVRLGLLGTARAVLTDGPIPAGEKLGRRGITVRDAIVLFAKAQRERGN